MADALLLWLYAPHLSGMVALRITQAWRRLAFGAVAR